MGAKTVKVYLAMVYLCGLAVAVSSQEMPIDMSRRGGDPNNALIEGRVLLPSGQSANFNIKIILSDLKSNLATLYTNKHAEFRFPNLSQGIYYIQAVADEKVYEPVTATVRLARSQIFQLSITLRAKDEIVRRKSGSQIISAAEFNQAAPAAARKKYEQGVKFAGKGEAQTAIEHFQQAITIYPDYVAAHNDLGAQYLKLKEFDRADEHFRRALEQNPKYFNALFNLALVRMEQRDYAGAIARLNQAIEIDSSRPAAHFWLGIAMLNVGDLPNAERALSKALVMGGHNFASAHFYLAKVYLKRGDTAEAARALKAYLDELPDGENAEEAKLLLKKTEPANRPDSKSRL